MGSPGQALGMAQAAKGVPAGISSQCEGGHPKPVQRVWGRDGQGITPSAAGTREWSGLSLLSAAASLWVCVYSHIGRRKRTHHCQPALHVCSALQSRAGESRARVAPSQAWKEPEIVYPADKLVSTILLVA